jgi:hypothetical protein
MNICACVNIACEAAPPFLLGRSTAQAISYRLPTATARVLSQVRPLGGVCGQIGIGAFLCVFPFPLAAIPPAVPHSSTFITEGCYNLPMSARCTMWTQSLRTPRTNKQTPWPQSAGELYRPSESRLSAKLVPTCADRGCHVVSVTDPYSCILGFLDRSRYFFLLSRSSIVLTKFSGPRSRSATSQKTG